MWSFSGNACVYVSESESERGEGRGGEGGICPEQQQTVILIRATERYAPGVPP